MLEESVSDLRNTMADLEDRLHSVEGEGVYLRWQVSLILPAFKVGSFVCNQTFSETCLQNKMRSRVIQPRLSNMSFP